MKYIVLALALFSTSVLAGNTTYNCTDGEISIEMNPFTEDSVLLDDDQYNVVYDKTEGDVHYTKFRNNSLNQDAFLIVVWGSNNQVTSLSLVITPKDSKDELFSGECSNAVTN